MSFTFNGLDIGDGARDSLNTKAVDGVAIPHEKIDTSDKTSILLMKQNRAYRRQFKRKHGIFLHGSTRPVINKN